MLGASFNTVGQNAAFAKKLGVKFPLLCDVDRSLGMAYGACSGPRAQYAERISVLIGPDGRVERVYQQVDPRDHPARVLADIIG